MTSVLPARPDLEHLRREAKRLLDQLRATDPAAVARLNVHAAGMRVALSTAQFVIAREYGFSSWTQMKALVSRMSSGGIRYDTIGRGYSTYRRADPRIASAIHHALGDARTVVNVGAGTGSYEPTDRPVIPIEPSTAMALQRDPALPPAVLGVAESLPLADNTVDAALAVLTMHHWADVDRGISELLRVTRRRIVILTIDVDAEEGMWLFQDYVPQVLERDRQDFPPISHIVSTLGASSRIVDVPVPADCTDRTFLAFWSRPEAVLDPAARAATSGFARLPDSIETAAVAKLGADLESGAWEQRHGHLRSLSELDVGLRLIITELR